MAYRPTPEPGCPMPQSYTCLHYHIIFSTKGREPTIAHDWQPRLYSFIGGVLRTEGGLLVAAGGVADHVHLLARLGQQKAVADVVRAVKANSSRWVHDLGPSTGGFAWQTGYAALSVSYSQLDVVTGYLARQDEHHRTQTFQDELRAVLRRHGFEPDEEHLWG